MNAMRPTPGMSIASIIKVPRDGETVSLQRAIYDGVFAGWLAPKNASLLYAVCFVVLWFGILAVMYNRKVFLKV